MLPPIEDEEDLSRKPAQLSPEEQEEVDAHVKLRPLAIYEVVRQIGVEELRRPLSSLWWSGLAAGLSIGFSVLTEGALQALLPDAGWRPLLSNWGYSVGFLIVVMARHQLFTEITLTAVLPVLARPSAASLAALLRIWTIVFLANMAGTAAFAAGLSTESLVVPWLRDGVTQISRHLATMVWVMPMADAARFWMIALITYLIALFELAHVVAGSVEVFFLLFAGELGLEESLFGLIAPMLAGNIIGGSALFALLAYGQVREEMEPGR